MHLQTLRLSTVLNDDIESTLAVKLSVLKEQQTVQVGELIDDGQNRLRKLVYEKLRWWIIRRVGQQFILFYFILFYFSIIVFFKHRFILRIFYKRQT